MNGKNLMMMILMDYFSGRANQKKLTSPILCRDYCHQDTELAGIKLVLMEMNVAYRNDEYHSERITKF